MLLALDVGNTNTVVGLYRGNELINHWRLETKKERTADELGIFLKELLGFANISFSDIDAVAIANVVPTFAFALNGLCERYLKLKPFVVTADCRSSLKILIDNPSEVGADRLVNAVAAHAEHKADLVVIDFGTATTFDCMTANGEYRGGIIYPGITISAEALFQRASKLPRVEIKRPERVIGKNTVGAMQSGLYYGYVGLVDSVVQRMEAEFGKSLKAIATGGLAPLIAADSETIVATDDFLTLKGLKILWEMNR